MRIPLLASSAAALSLAACGPQVHAPSLAPRAVETLPIALPDEAAEPDSAVDPALAARIEPLIAAARAGDAAFGARRGEAAALIARAAGSAEGSEAWIAAQQALSGLDAARAPVRDAVAGIAALRVEPANAARGNRAAIEAAAQQIEAIDDAEAAAIAALAASLER